MNYFKNKRVAWNTWSVDDIVFKSNNLIKKVLPSNQVMSWTSKGDRDKKMCQRTGCQSHSVKHGQGQSYTYYSTDNYKGIMVQLKEMKSDFPSANIDFIDCTNRIDSVGNPKGKLGVLIYLNSFHQPWEWKRCPQTGDWTRQPVGQIAPLQEGYRMCYGGQGGSDSLDFDEFHEMIQITEAIKDFLVDIVVPFKNGTLQQTESLVNI